MYVLNNYLIINKIILTLRHYVTYVITFVPFYTFNYNIYNLTTAGHLDSTYINVIMINEV